MSAEQKPEERTELTAPEKVPLKKKKLAFEEFFEALRVAISSVDKRAAGQAYQLVKRGFAGDVTSERVQMTVDLLRRWPEVDRLAARVCVEQRTSRLNPFTRQVANALRLGFSLSLGYPLRNTAAPDTSAAIMQWVENADSATTREATPTEVVSGEQQYEAKRPAATPEQYLRMKFICLLGESDEGLICEATYALLGRQLKGGKKGNSLPTSRDFIKLVGALIASPKISAAAIANVLSAAAPMGDIVTGLQERESDLSRRLQTAHRRISELEETEFSLRGQLDESEEKVTGLRGQVGEKDEALTEWEERYQALDLH